MNVTEGPNSTGAGTIEEIGLLFPLSSNTENNRRTNLADRALAADPDCPECVTIGQILFQ